MTNLDRTNTLPGYYPSHWPVECGGNRRQKAAKGGLNARDAEPNVTTVTNGRWNVMTVWRGPAELYMGGTQPAFSGPPPFGWLQRLDPEIPIERVRKFGPKRVIDGVDYEFHISISNTTPKDA